MPTNPATRKKAATASRQIWKCHFEIAAERGWLKSTRKCRSELPANERVAAVRLSAQDPNLLQTITRFSAAPRCLHSIRWMRYCAIRKLCEHRFKYLVKSVLTALDRSKAASNWRARRVSAPPGSSEARTRARYPKRRCQVTPKPSSRTVPSPLLQQSCLSSMQLLTNN